MSLNSTPRTWTTGELVTAAMMNAEIQAAISGIEAAWTAYTPTWTSNGTAPALGTGGSIVGAYQQIGKTVNWRVKLTAGTTGFSAGTGAYFISLPPSLAPNTSPAAIGNMILQSAGAAYSLAAVYWPDSGAMRFYTSASPGIAWSATAPFSFVASAIMAAQGEFEIP